MIEGCFKCLDIWIKFSDILCYCCCCKCYLECIKTDIELQKAQKEYNESISDRTKNPLQKKSSKSSKSSSKLDISIKSKEGLKELPSDLVIHLSRHNTSHSIIKSHRSQTSSSKILKKRHYKKSSKTATHTKSKSKTLTAIKSISNGIEFSMTDMDLPEEDHDININLPPPVQFTKQNSTTTVAKLSLDTYSFCIYYMLLINRKQMRFNFA